jgi:hypothetical protein
VQKLIAVSLLAVGIAFLFTGIGDATQPSAAGPYVAAGHYIQQFDTQNGSLIGNVTSGWAEGASNSELHFGPDGNLFGFGGNAWVYEYDFATGLTSIFAKPTGDLGATGLALGSDLNWYVAAGHYIQRFSEAGVFLGNVTSNWVGGASNTELHFGRDNNLYGIGSNAWVYKYDFVTDQTTVFAKPTGDVGATGLTLGPDSNWYVAAGHYIQDFSPAGAFIGNVTTSWIGGSSNTELQFGPGNNLYGIGANAWIFKYDFGTGQTSVFSKPTGDVGATGLASLVPEPSVASAALVAGLILLSRRYRAGIMPGSNSGSQVLAR